MAAMVCFSIVIPAGCEETPQQKQARIDAGIAEYQGQIRAVVHDPARADVLVSTVGEFQKLVHEAAAMTRNDRARVASLNANYEATRADFDALFREESAEREALVRKAIGLREQMTTLTTDAEWEQLKKTRDEQFTAALRELQ
jgi:hypothetical protein